jgi:plasmid stabilization system protein ParE
MALREIQWTKQAENQLSTLLDYYDQRNGSSTYSEKIVAKIYKQLGFVQRNSYYGQSLTRIKDKNARYVIVEKIQVSFEVSDETVYVFAVFDVRRDPKTLKKILASIDH